MEVVEISIRDLKPVEIFCKYSGTHSHNSFGHRGGVEYEGKVYQLVLNSVSFTVPKLIGVYNTAHKNEHWLFVELLKETKRLPYTKDSEALMIKAAEWIARFHAHFETTNCEFKFLNKYTFQYYMQWIEKTKEVCSQLAVPFSWLHQFCENAGRLFSDFALEPMTLIHGEYYHNNILSKNGVIYPVDWESTAIGVAEIDLASLLEGGWNESLVNNCKLAYKRIRWQNVPDKEFERRFNVAQIYWHIRWIGESDINDNILVKHAFRIEQLEKTAKQLDLI